MQQDTAYVEEWVDVYEEMPEQVSAHQATPSINPAPDVPVMQRLGNGALFGAAAFFGATFLVSVIRYTINFNKAENKSRRKMLKNRDVVTTLAEYMPSNRSAVTKAMIGGLRFKTGYSNTEMFRKFLWYILRDRKFDQEAVDDLLHLKQVMGLTDDDVAEALKERSQRIERKYGNLMLQLDGLSERGLQRKATCRALFSKVLYLIEQETFLNESRIMNVEELRNIFGATEEDIAKLRIVSLQEVDMDKLDSMISEGQEE